MAKKSVKAAAKKSVKTKSTIKPDRTFLITGHVLDRETRHGVAGLLVKAVDKDQQFEQPLGNATTDAEGRYEITFNSSKIGKNEKGGPDIIVKVFDKEGKGGKELAASEVIYNAPAKVKIDIAVTLVREPALSEYEKFLATLRPLLQGRQIADFKADEIITLAKESGIEQKRIEFLVQCAKLSRETDVPTEILYGLARMDLTPTLEVLFTHDTEKLRRAIETASRVHIIPAISATALDRIMGDVEAMRFRPLFSKASLTDLLPSVRLTPDSHLAVRLNELNITTPAILIATGAERIMQRAGLTEAEGAVIKDIESHARLSLLNVSTAARKVLFNGGFLSPTQIASEPETSFRQKVESILGPSETARIHGVASVQKAFLDNLSTAARLVPRNIIGSVSFAAGVAGESDNDLADCGCKDCEAATSPAAYLTDLLSYTKAKLSWQYDPYFPTEPVTPEFLSLLLKQPIADLPTDCESVEEEISYVRLCIESLLVLFRENLAANPDVACSPLKRRVSFAFAADVNGDRQDELIIGFDPDYSTLLGARHEVGTGVWVMHHDKTTGGWNHLAPGNDPTAATFYLPPGLKVRFAFAGKFREDSTNVRNDRRQLVLAIEGQGIVGLPIWVLEFDPIKHRWEHVNPGPRESSVEPGGMFEPDILDFAISHADVHVVGGFAADVDGDQLDEFVAYGTTPTQKNAFWVFKRRDQGWESVGLVGADHDVAFDCYTPPASSANYQIKLATSGDVNSDGRAEIIAFPDAPGNFGKNPWIMRFDTANNTWNHILPPGTYSLDADAELGANPWPAAHAFVAQITGVNSAELVVAPVNVLTTYPSNPNQFSVFRYLPPAPPLYQPYFDELSPANCSPTRDSVTFAIAADIDGDLHDELVVLTRKGNTDAAWVMDRTNAGTWQHLSPIAGHPLGADLEWTTGGVYPAQFAFAADVDGDGQKEVVIVGNTCTEIWVMKYRASKSRWEQVRAQESSSARYEGAAYLALLTQLGTSYEEVRMARSADDVARRAFADRLAISLCVRTGAVGDRLDQLVSDPAVVTEGRLEELFGLVSTNRDPLSNVTVFGDVKQQTRHWRIKGLEWSGDPVTSTTDPEGKIYVEFGFNSGTGKVVVVLFRDAARQFAVAMGEGPRTGEVIISSLRSSGLSGRVSVDYKADTSSIVLTALPQFACWQSARLREQWDDEDWQADAFSGESGSVSGGVPRPIIDPDVIGPDDFRLPLPKTGATAPDVAFDIWRNRRVWVDGLLVELQSLQPNLDEVFERLRPPVGAPTPNDYPWHDAPPVADFPGLLYSLSNGDARIVEQTRETLRTKLFLSSDAFSRIMALRSKYLLDTQQLSDAEWGEIRSILAQAYKVSRFGNWRQEERSASVGLDGESFVATALPPIEGVWPPESFAAAPLIDPELIAVTELPASIAGIEARELWRERSNELRHSLELLRAQRSAGLEQVLVESLGPAPTSGNWVIWINTRAIELQSSDVVVVSQAESAIRSAMPGISLSIFRRIAALTAKPTGTVLSDAQWDDVDAGAAAVRKHRLLYPVWNTEETASGRMPYWKARRAALPRWRASSEYRTQWEQALLGRTRPPVVDPDRLPEAWIRNPGSRAYELYYGRPITGAKPGRLRELRIKEDALRSHLTSAASTLEGIDAAIIEALTPDAETERVRADVTTRRQTSGFERLLGEVFGEQIDGLDQLLVDLNQGGDTAATARKDILQELCFGSVTAFQAVMAARQDPAAVGAAQWQVIERSLSDISIVRWTVRADRRSADAAVKLRVILDQLGFSTSAWRRLCAYRRLAAQGGPTLLTEETDEFIAILLRANKVRRYGRWRTEERGDGSVVPVRLGPDAFQISSAPYLDERPWEPPAWRVLPSELRWWQETLDARTAQHKGIFIALRTSVTRVEDDVLPLLRDQLIASLPAAGRETDAAARWAQDFLLIDPKAGGCQRTTRVAHAIDSVLALLWSIRTGQLNDTYPQFRLEDSTFDKDWRWIGSYSTWRSAILVHLYPENLLLPRLKRRQSPAFKALVQALSSGSRVTPSRARQLANTYAEYLRDVCSLQLKGCIEAWTRHFPDSENQDESLHRVAFLFGLASSNKAYWCMRDKMAGNPQFAQSFWDQLDGFSGPVLDLIGASIHIPSTGNRPTTLRPKVFVFAKVASDSGEALEFIRYDLELGTWDSEATPLEVPGKPVSFAAVLLSNVMTAPPMLEIYPRIRNAAGQEYEALYVGSLNQAGNGWERDSPRLLSTDFGAWFPFGQDVTLDGPTVGIQQIASGDFDADGRDELLVGDEVQDHDAAWENDFWFLDYSDGRWSAERNLNCSDKAIRARYVFVGDINGDGRDEILVAADNPVRNRFWVLRYDGTSWQHVGTPPGFIYDLNCNSWDIEKLTKQFDVPTEFSVCGDFDGDGQDEVAIAISPGIHPVGLYTETTYSGFWIFKLKQGTWKRQGDLGLLHAAFECCTDLQQKVAAAFAVTGDFDGDGRDEIAVAVAPKAGNESLGNDFWVMDYREDRWQPLGSPEGAARTVFDLGTEQVAAAFAVAGDFDGDGRDELIIAPFVQGSTAVSELWLADFIPGPDLANPGEGGHWNVSKPDGLKLSFAAAGGVAGDFDADGRDELALIPFTGNSVQIADFAPDANQWQILPPFGKLDLASGTAFAVAGNFEGGTNSRRGLGIVAGSQEIVNGSDTGTSPWLTRRYRGNAQGQRSVSAKLFVKRQVLPQCSCSDFKPNFDGPYTIRERVDSQMRRTLIAETLGNNVDKPLSQQTYLREAFYFVPLQIALALQRARNYESALDWFRLVYDYSQPYDERKIYTGLDDDHIGGTNYLRNLLQWVQDPLDPHTIAETRPGTYIRATLLFLIRCLLEYADAEFAQDTSEAIERARILYGTALELLTLPDLEQRLGGCNDIIARIPISATEPVLRNAAKSFENKLLLLGSRAAMSKHASEIAAALDQDGTVADRLANAEFVLARALSGTDHDKTVGTVLANASAIAAARHGQILQQEGVMSTVAAIDTAELSNVYGYSERAGKKTSAISVTTGLTGVRFRLRMLYPLDNKHGYCVSPNPILKALRFHAEVNLFKIRTCRNIAGMRRSLELYSSSTDQTSGLPMIGVDGQLVISQTGTLTPTPYRYSSLIQRAKELAGQAQQMEGLMLSSIEKRDAEAQTLIKSRQDIQVARATVRIQQLRVSEAQDRVALAELQKQRAEIEGGHYQQLLDAGDLELEREAIVWLEQAARYTYAAASLEIVASIAQSVAASAYTVAAYYAIDKAGAVAGAAGATAGVASATASSLSSLAQAASTWSQIQQMRASRERTREEWQLRVQFATQEQKIGDQQIRIETDQVRIADQELAVSDLQTSNAEKLLDFQMQKFTNLDLYDWMSGVLERTYSFMLQQATAMAQLAARQIAFERQEGQPPAIQADYWEPIAEGMDSPDANKTAPDRRGLTGSARLLQDIYQLDQWAFDTNKRKLQLSKTFSLAQLFPIGFEQLRTTGVMTFNTPTQLFDYEFPGHYHRLTKRVSVSVVALVPPSQGIHATLSNTGISRVVVGPDIFQTILVRRLPESIALTSPINTTGMFTFETQADFANPFESHGVDTTWEFRMPKAGNLFDYTTLADVLLIIDYTALDSVDYRQQVVKQLERRFAGDRAFSLRREFPDTWWDLHNPGEGKTPFMGSFQTRREDYPPNLQDLGIEDVSLLFVTGTSIPTEAMPVTLKFTEKGATGAIGGSATPVDRLVSTRRANGGPWRPIIGKTPSGRWDLTLVDSPETREWFEGDDLLDILVVVSYVAKTPAWPQ